MPTALNLSDVSQVFIVLIGVALLLKKIVDMEGYHALRVFVLTSILSCIVIYCFLAYVFTPGFQIYSECQESDTHYCQTEV